MRVSYLAFLLLLGCPRTDGATDAAPATSVAAVAASTLALAPISDTATVMPSTTVTPLGAPTGVATAAAATGTVRPTPSASTTGGIAAGAKFRACCSALRKQAQQQPAQATQFTQAASVCDGLVAAMDNAGSSPQLEQLTPFLQGATLPPVCQGK